MRIDQLNDLTDALESSGVDKIQKVIKKRIKEL